MVDQDQTIKKALLSFAGVRCLVEPDDDKKWEITENVSCSHGLLLLAVSNDAALSLPLRR
jgi:hypothetical protein